MGRGNVCVTGPYEGLYYIDSDDYFVYRADDTVSEYPETRLGRELDNLELLTGDWLFDVEGTMNELEDIEECFKQDFRRMFPSFKDCPETCGLRVGGDWRRVLLENKLFYVCAEDNGMSEAIELIQKEGTFGDELAGLQARHFARYLDGIKACLLKRLPSIGGYKGAHEMTTIAGE